MKAIQFIALAATISAFSIACSDNKQPETTEPSVEVVKAPTVSEQASMLNASVDSAWHAVIQVDSQKFANIKRLVEEISYCKKYDEKGVAKALKLTAEMKSYQYTQDNLSDSLITLYDNKTDELIRYVRNLKNSTQEIEQHPLADQLENEITEADNQLVNYRSRYDVLAVKYNSFLDTNKEAIGKKKRVFSIPA
jgi:prophage DNA circulation protein